MADLSNLFSQLILPVQSGTPDELDPRIAALLDEKNRIASETEAAKGQKNSVLEKMGVTPEMQYQQMLDADKPKGFWKTLGKYAMEGLNGAVGGRSYVPYSERLRGQAENNYKLEAPLLKEQLDSVSKQESKLNEDQRRLAEAAANMDIKIDDIGVKRQNADTKRASVDQNGLLIPGKINEMNARAGKSGADANLAEMRAAMVEQQRQDLIKRGAMTGDDANNNVMSQLNPDRLASILGVRKQKKDQDAAAKLAGTRPPAGRAASGPSFKESGKLIDEDTALPLLFDSKSGTYFPAKLQGDFKATPKVTGENAGAASRAASGYVQVQQLYPLIDKLAKDGKFGLMRGGWDKLLANQGALKDPDIARYVNMVDSISKFGVGIHGMKAEQAARKMYDRAMLLMTDPETAKAGVDPVERAFAERAVAIPGSGTYFRQFGIDPEKVRQFVKDGMSQSQAMKKVAADKTVGVKESAGEPTLEQIRAEVARRRAMKGTK
jgi:hypothetical protein